MMDEVKENTITEEKKMGPSERHDFICAKIIEYVNNPENFKDCGKNIREIADALGFPYSTVSRNLQLLQYEAKFDLRVRVIKKGKTILVDNRSL